MNNYGLPATQLSWSGVLPPKYFYRHNCKSVQFGDSESSKMGWKITAFPSTQLTTHAIHSFREQCTTEPYIYSVHPGLQVTSHNVTLVWNKLLHYGTGDGIFPRRK